MPKARLPLAQSLMSRNGDERAKDVYVQNGYVDKYGEKLYVIKRPGTVLFDSVPSSNNPQGVTFYNGNVYMVFDDILYRTGGAEFVGADGTAWTQAPTPVWYGRSFFTATVFQNRIYVIGGEAPSNTQRTDISYTSDGVTWSTSAGGAPFGHRQGHACVVFQDQLWLLGGDQADATPPGNMNDIWSSPDGTNWTRVVEHAEWSARDNHTVVVANNGIYLYGGDTGGVGSDEVWYSADGLKWTLLTSTATGTGRYVHSSLFFDNKLWIVGGVNTSITALNDVWSSPDGQTWTLVNAAAFGAGRYDMATVVYNGRMWFISGVGGTTIDANIYSTTDGVTWTSVTATPGFTARGGACAVNFKTPLSVSANRYATMWLLGGNNGTTELQEVWRADLNVALASSYALNPTTASQSYDFNTFLNNTDLLIKNATDFWVLQSGVLTKVSDSDYPATTVPGIVMLNSFAYVMTPEGEIRSCAIDDPLHWPSLQFIFADYEDDPGVAIIKYLNYLVAFGTYTVQFFYDAGNPAPGTALSPYQAASYRVGCAFAATLKNINNTLIWVGQTQQREWSVYLFDGLTPKKISTDWVDRILLQHMSPNVGAFVTGGSGHTFYVLNIAVGHPALVYDMGTGFWSTWNSSAAEFQYSYAVSMITPNQNVDLWFGKDTLAGNFYTVGFNTYDDDGTPFPLVVQTDKVDGGSLDRKFWGRLDFIADQNPGLVTVQVTDDDYDTYSTWGIVDIDNSRPYLNRGGSSRRRAFKLTQTDSNPARWEALELTFSQGES